MKCETRIRKTCRLCGAADFEPVVPYTAKLVARGMEKAAQKLGEEAVETVIAAVAHPPKGLVSESADLLYHLLVVLRLADVPLADVLAELERRTGETGLQEKESRPKN